jgi:hypothetical protein
VHDEQLPLDEEPVGKQRDNQGEQEEVDDSRVRPVDMDRTRFGQDQPGPDGEHRNRQHRAAHQAGQRGRRRQQHPAVEKRLPEPDVHARLIQRVRSAA